MINHTFTFIVGYFIEGITLKVTKLCLVSGKLVELWFQLCIYICSISTRQQERGLMHKTRRLMDENSVFLQMYLILFSFITLGSES